MVLTKLTHYQIYKSRWSLTKCLYLACRFGLLLGWPVVMYAFLFDHDEESCQPFVVGVSVLFTLFVRSVLSLLLINSLLTLLTQPYIPTIASLSSMYMDPPRIRDHRCKTLVTIHLSALLLCLPLCRLLGIFERNGTLERLLSNIR